MLEERSEAKAISVQTLPKRDRIGARGAIIININTSTMRGLQTFCQTPAMQCDATPTMLFPFFSLNAILRHHDTSMASTITTTIYAETVTGRLSRLS